eukprot:5287175-Prorocentrum_lima.AAC.1
MGACGHVDGHDVKAMGIIRGEEAACIRRGHVPTRACTSTVHAQHAGQALSSWGRRPGCPLHRRRWRDTAVVAGGDGE